MNWKQERGKTRLNKKPKKINYNNLLEELQAEREMGNLSLLEKTLLKQKEESEIITATKICRDNADEVKLKRRRDSLMLDISNLYAYSNKDGIYHDRDCALVSNIPNSEFEMSKEFNSMKYCAKCYRRMILRAGIIDDYKHLENYYNFFKGGADNGLLHYLVFQNGGKFRFTDELKNCIKIKVREDTWLLKRIDDIYHLYHNNYIKLENNERHFTDGFHEQQCRLSTNAYFAICTICQYSYAEHIETEEQTQKEKILYGYDCPRWIKRLIKELKDKQSKKE